MKESLQKDKKEAEALCKTLTQALSKYLAQAFCTYLTRAYTTFLLLSCLPVRTLSQSSCKDSSSLNKPYYAFSYYPTKAFRKSYTKDKASRQNVLPFKIGRS